MIKKFTIKKQFNEIVIVYEKTGDIIYVARNKEKYKAVEECYAYLSSFNDYLVFCEVEIKYKKET